MLHLVRIPFFATTDHCHQVFLLSNRVVFFCKEDDFDGQKSCQESRFVIDSVLYNFLEAGQLSNLFTYLRVFASQEMSFDEFGDRYAQSYEQLWRSIDSDPRFCICGHLSLLLFSLFLCLPGFWDYFSDNVISMGQWVVYKGHRLFWVANQEKKVQHKVGHFRFLASLLGLFVDTQVRKQTVIRLKTKHVDCVTTSIKKALIVLLDEGDRVVQESLWI